MVKSLGKDQNFLGIEKEFSDFDTADVVIVSAPFEHATTYGGGAKNGPRAILEASRQVEVFDEETKREICKEHGIATLPPLSLSKKKDEVALQEIHNTVSGLLGRNKFVVTLGGEHTISSATIAAHARKFIDLSVLQFDAHSGLRNEYQGNKYSHASVMARVCEFLEPVKLVQVGVRAQCREEAEFVRDHNVHAFYAHEIRNGVHTRFLRTWDDAVVDTLSDQVYVTFDVDGFDPSIMPSTGTPEPNGLYWDEVMRCLRKVGQKKRIVGLDVVELAPIKGLRHPDLMTAKLVSKILNYAL